MHVNPENSNLENDATSEATAVVPTPVNAIIHISITDKGLRAYLNIEPPENGGKAPTLELLNAALSSQHISYNVDFERINDLASNPIYGEDILVATGLEPVDGINGSANFLIKTEKSTLAPKTREDGTVDYRDLDIVENVVKGQTLCTIIQPTEGSPGFSVQGKELLQKKGRPAPSYLGRNTELSSDGTAILSKIDGQVEFVGNKINVDETFHIKENVDNSTGNIQVAGNLVIRGMVLPGFFIEAGGNVEIGGAIEHATIKAGGTVKLLSGINGSELYCSGDLKCKYIENSAVFVKGDLFTESIINSTVKCGKSIKVSGSIAKIIGGSCIAGQNIEANTIGSLSNVKTTLELGTDQFVIERQQKLLTQVAELEAQNESLIPLLDILMQLDGCNRLIPEKKKILDDVRYSYENNLQILEAAKNELEEIAFAMKAKGFGRIICTDTIHPGTKVLIGDASRIITDSMKNTSLYYHEGEICTVNAR